MQKMEIQTKAKPASTNCALRVPSSRCSMDESHCSPSCNPLFSSVHEGRDHYAIAKHLIAQPLDTTGDHAISLLL